MSMGHPQTNGEIEVANWTILQDLKIRLNQVKGLSANELDNVLWSNRTTPYAPTGEIPFKLSYEAVVAIPMKIGLVSDHIRAYDECTN